MDDLIIPISLSLTTITLLRSITMLCGTDSIPRNILHIQTECEKHSMSVPRNIVMDLNNVTTSQDMKPKLTYHETYTCQGLL